MRFLFRWQHVEASSRLTGLDGLREIVAALDGYELAAGAWERAVLPARLDRYEPSMLDMICLAGEAGWARLSPAFGAGRCRAQPGAGDADRALPARARSRRGGRCGRRAEEPPLGDEARHGAVGAPVARRLVLPRSRPGLPARRRPAATRDRRAGRLRPGATSDGFSGLRALVWAARGRPARHDRRSSFAGRWTADRRRRRERASRRRPSSCRRGRCCAATGSCSGAC